MKDKDHTMSFKDMKLRSGVGLLASKTDFEAPRLLNAVVMSQLEGSMKALSRHMKIEINRDDYLIWVQTWKSLYAQVSIVIRDLKDHRDNRNQFLGGNVWTAIRSHRQSDVQSIRKFATHLLEMRHINKILAGRARERAYVNAVGIGD
jgi:hypothetical protein